MFCFIYRWLISRGMDTEKKALFPGLLKRHVERCDACRDFAWFSRSLTGRLTRDAEMLKTLADKADPLAERIKLALDSQPLPAPSHSRPVPRRRHFSPFPALAAAAVSLFIVTGLVLQFIPSAPPANGSLDALPVSPTLHDPLQLAAGKIESPMESEMQALEQTAQSTAEFLVSCLDISYASGGQEPF